MRIPWSTHPPVCSAAHLLPGWAISCSPCRPRGHSPIPWECSPHGSGTARWLCFSQTSHKSKINFPHIHWKGKKSSACALIREKSPKKTTAAWTSPLDPYTAVGLRSHWPQQELKLHKISKIFQKFSILVPAEV